MHFPFCLSPKLKFPSRMLPSNLHLQYLTCSILVLRNLFKALKLIGHVMLSLLLMTFINGLAVSKFTLSPSPTEIIPTRSEHMFLKTISSGDQHSL
jgi:hypothetical protein